jgi:hypothetical protein
MTSSLLLAKTIEVFTPEMEMISEVHNQLESILVVGVVVFLALAVILMMLCVKTYRLVCIIHRIIHYDVAPLCPGIAASTLSRYFHGDPNKRTRDDEAVMLVEALFKKIYPPPSQRVRHPRKRKTPAKVIPIDEIPQ